MVHATRQSTGTQPADTAVWSRLWSRWIGHEPSHRRGPFARWPRTSDGVLAAAVFVASVIAVAANSLDEGQEFSSSVVGDLAAGAYLILGATAASLLWRRRQPIQVVGFILVALVVWATLGYGEGQDLALVFGLYSLGRYVTDDLDSVATVIAGIAVVTVSAAIDSRQSVDIAASLLFTLLPWYVGRRVRNRREYVALLQDRAAQLEREQRDGARRAVADERSRIARELHDVVAHRVSMMTVQAGAAKTIARTDIDNAVEAMGDVERAGRQALGELRQLVGVLRPDSADPDVLGPQPGIADIAALVDQITQTGIDVSLTIPDLPIEPAAVVDLAIYRIVQESLTNVIKHAGPNPTVDVRVAADDQQLSIEITNTTNAQHTKQLPRSGFGIIGMRERAELLGGTLDAGPRPGNRFTVLAQIPIQPEPT